MEITKFLLQKRKFFAKSWLLEFSAHHKLRLVPMIFGFLILSLITGCSSCKKIPNSDDTTPPQITWSIVQEGEDGESNIITHYTGDASHEIIIGTRYLVLGCANDEGGIKEIASYQITGNRCNGGNPGSGHSPLSTFPLGLDEEGLAWTKYCGIFEVSIGRPRACGDVGTFSGNQSFIFIGENSAGLSKQGTLTLTYSD